MGNGAKRSDTTETPTHLAIETLFKPGTAAYIPSGLKAISHKVFKSRLSRRHYKGMQEVKDLPIVGVQDFQDLGSVAVWAQGGVEYMVKRSDWGKLRYQAPKVYVSQDKNIKLLLALVELQQKAKPIEERRAEAEFTLAEYAKLRGYTEAEIQQGGRFFEELKRDLYTGAYTLYRIDEVIIEGQRYIAHGLPNFYMLYEPKHPKGKWRVIFNHPYASHIVELLRGEAKQYFTHYLKEIADRCTSEKPYLHLFYNQLVYRRRATDSTLAVKVSALLETMGVDPQVLKRPKRCFEVLAECIVYMANNYPEELGAVGFFAMPNSEGFWVYNQLVGESLFSFCALPYEEAMATLRQKLGIGDIRKVAISFRRCMRTAEYANVKPPTEDNLIDSILEWGDQYKVWERTSLERTKAEQILVHYIMRYGREKILRLYEQALGNPSCNPYFFFTQILPSELPSELP